MASKAIEYNRKVEVLTMKWQIQLSNIMIKYNEQNSNNECIPRSNSYYNAIVTKSIIQYTTSSNTTYLYF